MADDRKAELRRRMRGMRKSLSPEAAVDSAARAAVLLEGLPFFARARRVALYAPVRGEIATAPLDASLRLRGAVVYYPRVDPEAARLTFHRVDDPASLRAGRFEIPEPGSQAPLAAAREIDVVLVPGLAFDARGARVGHGMGYYDRTLPLLHGSIAVGFCYDFQLVSEVPNMQHDQPVAWVVTDRRAIEAFSSSGAFPGA
jgi:5-formyltetrahydrofolate cyclo-ligase